MYPKVEQAKEAAMIAMFRPTPTVSPAAISMVVILREIGIPGVALDDMVVDQSYQEDDTQSDGADHNERTFL